MKLLRSFRIGNRDWAGVRMSPDGGTVLAYWREGETMHAMIDGRPLPPVVRPGGSPLSAREWGPRYERSAWLVREGDGVYVEESSGKRRGPYLNARFGARGFSDDGQRLTYAFQVTESEWYVQVDDAQFGPYANVYGPGFGRGSNVSTWEFQRGNGSWFLQVEKDEYGPFDDRPAPVGITSPARVAFVLKRAGDYVFYAHGRELGPYRDKRPWLAVSPQSDRIAVAHFSGGRWEVLLDGDVLGSFGAIRTLSGAFSPDAKRFAFGFDEGERSGFWVDGERSVGFAYTDGPYWSSDSRHVAWGADVGRGRCRIVVNGVSKPLEAGIDWEQGSEFVFAPDGRFCLVLYDRKQDARFIRVGRTLHGVRHVRFPSHHRQCVQFSSDGSVFALAGSYGAARGGYIEWTGGRLGPFEVFDYALTSGGELILATLDVESLEVRHLSVRL